jgi:hypothetical protein
MNDCDYRFKFLIGDLLNPSGSFKFLWVTGEKLAIGNVFILIFWYAGI